MTSAGIDLDVRVSRPDDAGYVRTIWGEQARIRQTSSGSGGRLCVIDYKAPAGFGPPRHVHDDDDETVLLHGGTLVLWSPDGLSIARPGDLFFLPRRKPHTWLSIGDEAVAATLIITPGKFEGFFPTVAAERLRQEDVEDLIRVSLGVGMELTGPPLTLSEVGSFLDTV